MDNLVYGTHARQQLAIYQPKPIATKQGQQPILIFFYGGAWREGDRQDYRFLAEAFAAEGIMVVIPDYRLYPEIVYPDFLDDSARAVSWVLKNIAAYGGDPQRVYLMGHSAGAYNAAMLALDEQWLARYQSNPQQIRGWVGVAGPYNFLPITYDPIKPVFPYPITPVQTQPIYHVRSHAPPALLLASTTDTTVYTGINTVALAQKLESTRVPVKTRIYTDLSHAEILGAFSRPFRHWAPVVEDVRQFIFNTDQP